MTEPPKDYVSPQERLAEQDWAGVAKKGVASMAPADKGWVLAVVVIILLLQVGESVKSWMDGKAEIKRGVYLSELLASVEVHRTEEIAAQQKSSAEEARRLQEVIKSLADGLARQSERVGRMTQQKSISESIMSNPNARQ